MPAFKSVFTIYIMHLNVCVLTTLTTLTTLTPHTPHTLTDMELNRSRAKFRTRRTAQFGKTFRETVNVVRRRSVSDMRMSHACTCTCSTCIIHVYLHGMVRIY